MNNYDEYMDKECINLCDKLNSLEYVETTESISKACGWIENLSETHYIMDYSDSEGEDIEDLIKWFKNYMQQDGSN